MTYRLATILFSVTLSSAFLIAAAEQSIPSGESVAIVYDYAPDQPVAFVDHVGMARTTLRSLQWLRDGDVLTSSGSSTVRINFDDGAVETYTLTPGSSMPISSRTHKRSQVATWAEWLADWFGAEQGRGRSSTAVTRGPGIVVAIPGLEEGSARILAGPRQMQLAWRGAVGTVSVQLSGPSGESLFSGQSPDGAVTTPILQMEPGTYQWMLKDSFKPTPITFAVVERARFPRIEGATLPSWVSPDIQETIAAMRLAQNLRDAWSYEAWLSLQPLAARYRPAKEFRDALSRGRAPPPTGDRTTR